MKLYVHEYNSFKKTIITTEVEADEKPKTYVTKRAAGIWETRILKGDLGKMHGQYPVKMFTLTPDATPFVNELIKKTDAAIDGKLKAVEELREKKAALIEYLKGNASRE